MFYLYLFEYGIFMYNKIIVVKILKFYILYFFGDGIFRYVSYVFYEEMVLKFFLWK